MTSAYPTGPLAPEIYDTNRTEPSWWEATAPPPRPRDALINTIQTEFVIIGGGYAGLSAARRLAELDREAIVLEAGEIGWGASGRNGGMVCFGGHKLSDAALLKRYGTEETGRYYRLQSDGICTLRALIDDWQMPELVQGDGEILLAHSAKTARALATEVSANGIEIEAFPPGDQTGISRFGGILMRPGFGTHPLRLVRRLAEHAEEAGARLFPHSRALSWCTNDNTHRLRTAHGEVLARHIILATNGFTPDGLIPAFDARAVPVISNIAVTRVLTGDERAALPWLGPTPLADTRNMLAYFRLLPEGRLMLGMRGDTTGSEAGRGRMKRAVAARIAHEMPVLAGIEIDHFWRGPVCANAKLSPAVGRLPEDHSIGFAFGWHGAGINLAQIGGRLIAEVMAGDNRGEALIPAPMRGLPRRLFLPALRPQYVGLMKAVYALQDRFS